MRVLLISTYELGHPPFGLASPAARLRDAGNAVTCLDLAVGQLDETLVATAELVALYVPMHTATRLATALIPRIRKLNPRAHLCCYGLYAPVNARFLTSLGVQTILGGEFEDGLVALVERLGRPDDGVARGPQPEPLVSLARQTFIVPDRTGLPPLDRYAKLLVGHEAPRLAGYTEASRGCKHLCRHCPIVPVYNGVFRVVPREIVLGDIDQQVAAGARHMSFGDPDFFNGPTHALRLVQGLHRAHPTVSYDVTIKVEHLLKHAALLPVLRETGCLFVTSAVEAVDDAILARFAKNHTRADFVRAVSLMRSAGLTLAPTFVTFTPWTTLAGYVDLLQTLVALDLVDHVAPVQYAIRLLIPAGSRLLELPEVQALAGSFDERALVHPWRHPDPRVDELYEAVRRCVQDAPVAASRREIFAQVWQLAHAALGAGAPEFLQPASQAEAPVPHLSEPWYC